MSYPPLINFKRKFDYSVSVNCDTVKAPRLVNDDMSVIYIEINNIILY